MRLEDLTISLRKIVPAAILVTGCVLFGTHLFAATNARMTIYQKNTTPKVFDLSSVKNVTFGFTAVGRAGLANKIEHSIRLLPSIGSFRFNVSGDPRTRAQVRIFNIAGREIFFRRFVLGNNGRGMMTVPGLTNGLYIIQMKNGSSMITRRVSVAR